MRDTFAVAGPHLEIRMSLLKCICFPQCIDYCDMTI